MQAQRPCTGPSPCVWRQNLGGAPSEGCCPRCWILTRLRKRSGGPEKLLCKSCHIFTSTRNYRIHKCWTILYLTLTRLWFSKGVQWIRLGRVMDSPCSIIFAVLALCLSLPTTSADSKFGKLTVVHGQYIAICIYIKKTYLPAQVLQFERQAFKPPYGLEMGFGKS